MSSNTNEAYKEKNIFKVLAAMFRPCVIFAPTLPLSSILHQIR
jgi:hypothetical protein